MKLTRFETAWGHAALATMFPGSREEGWAEISGMDVSGYLADVMASLPFKPALGLRAAIWIVTWAPLFVLGRVATLASLSQADRERVVASLLVSSSYGLRSLVTLLKAFGALLYAGDDRVRARIRPRPAGRRSLVPLRIKRAPVS